MGILDKLKSLVHREKTLDVDARFELLREAVSGTMSNFYMAKDRDSGDVVGLKLCDAAKLQLFEARFKGLDKPAEGEIAISLKHPRVVETLEHGKTSKGLRYLVMEFLEGPGLHTLIQNRNPILDGKKLTLIRQMAEALQYVHEAEYIHRDVCPRNFICRPDCESLKLIDFGLTVPAERAYMQPGNRTGTAVYMAPEVVRRRWTDRRLDIFSFGMTAYHLCTYAMPWPVGDNPALSAMAHDSTSPADIFTHCPQLNKELGTAIMQCLAAEAASRPQTADDFLHLIRCVQHEYDG